MKPILKTTLLAVLCLILGLNLLSPAVVFADDGAARDISGAHLVTASFGIPQLFALFDNSNADTWKTAEGAFLTIQDEGGMGSLYLTFGETPGTILTGAVFFDGRGSIIN